MDEGLRACNGGETVERWARKDVGLVAWGFGGADGSGVGDVCAGG